MQGSMREVRDFILNEIADKIHSKEEIEGKVRERFSCSALSHILDLTLEGKLVQVRNFLVPFSEYTCAREKINRIINEKGGVYLPLLRPNSAEEHIVEQMIESGKIHLCEGGHAGTGIHNESEEKAILTPEIVYLFRKRGFIDLRGCTNKGVLERFGRLVRDGIAREFEGRYIHKKVYQELLIDAGLHPGKDWISRADALAQKFRLPYEFVADIIPKK